MAIMEIARLEVKSTTTFSFPDVYTALHDFMYENGFCNDADAGFPEKFYSESRTQTKGKEIWVWWRFKKPYSGTGGSSFVNVLIDIDFHGIGIRDLEIMYNDKKIGVNKGKIEIVIRGRFEIDPNDKLKKSFIGSFMDSFINKYWRKELLDYRQDVVNDLNKIRNYAAQLLDKQTTDFLAKPFHPTLGYKREDF